jgi:hypothetical protein
MLGLRVGVWEINRAQAMAFGKFGGESSRQPA